MGSNTQDARNLTPDEQRRLIRAEIGEPSDIPATKMEDILKQYSNVTTDEELEGYLAKTAFYKNGTWKLPRRKKMTEKFEEKKRHIEEKGWKFVDKMRERERY